MYRFKAFLASALLALGFNVSAEEGVQQPEMTVYRSPTCGCCGKWIAHAKAHNFKIKDVISDDMDAIKKKYGVPEKLASCHTAVIDGQVIEGHVPAEDIYKLRHDQPNVAGIAAPGMPMGSPGMEMGGREDVYQVVSFDKEGRVAVFAEHGGDR